MSPRPAEPRSPAGGSRPEREAEILDCLRAVVDPELGDTIVDLGMVRGISVEGGDVTVDIALTIAACPLRSQIERDVVGHVRSLDWVRSVDVAVAAMDAEERAAVMARARWKAREDAPETAIAGVDAGAGHRLGERWGGQVVRHCEPGRGAGRPWSGGRHPRRGHLGVLGAAPARNGRRRRGAAGQDGPPRAPHRGGHAAGPLHGVPGRRGAGDHVARPRAQPGGPAVPAGCPLGRSGLPPDRPAAGDRRHPDGTGAPVATHRAARRDHATGRRAEGGRPRRRHGPSRLSAGGRRDREHERFHLRARHDVRALRLGRRRAAGPRPGRPAGGLDSPSSGPFRRRRRRRTGGPGGGAQRVGPGVRGAGARRGRGRGARRRRAGVLGTAAGAGRGCRRAGRTRERTDPAVASGRPLRRRPSGSRWCPLRPARPAASPRPHRGARAGGPTARTAPQAAGVR